MEFNFVLLLKALHVMLFVCSLVLTEGVSLFLLFAARRGIAEDAVTVFELAQRFGITGGIGWALTGVTGFILALLTGISLTTTWLVWSTILFIVLMLNGIFIHARWEAKVLDCLSETPSHMAGLKLNEMSSSISKIAGAFVSGISISAILLLMVMH